MTAFEQAWALFKADQDFITVGGPREVAEKRTWLYGEEWPEDEDEQQELIDKYGEHYSSLGQASTEYGYEQEPRNWYSSEMVNDYTKPKRGPGRTILNLPAINESLQYELDEEYDEREDAPKHLFAHDHPDYQELDYSADHDVWRKQNRQNRQLDSRLKAERAYWNRGRPTVSDESLIDEIIRVTNHEVGHTTQIDEEDDWKAQYTTKNAPLRIPSDWRTSWRNETMRNVLMQESLAILQENPHDTDWRKRLAAYENLGLDDHHDLMREVSANMVRFFDENPESYRDPDEVAQRKAQIKELLARSRDDGDES